MTLLRRRMATHGIGPTPSPSSRNRIASVVASRDRGIVSTFERVEHTRLHARLQAMIDCEHEFVYSDDVTRLKRARNENASAIAEASSFDRPRGITTPS